MLGLFLVSGGSDGWRIISQHIQYVPMETPLFEDSLAILPFYHHGNA